MTRHPFRPLDAVLGLALAVVGVLVAVFGFDDLDSDQAVTWFALGALAIGFGLLPWPRRNRASATPPPSTHDEATPAS